jgi:phage terminase large subunit-like protein
VSNPKLEFFGALDLSSSLDLTAYVQLFHKPEFYVKCQFFMPGENLRRRVLQDHVPYDLWAQQGFITVTRGNVLDEEAVIEAIFASIKKNKCREIAYDPWNAPHIVTRLSDEGIEMVPVRQGFVSLNYPSKELEKLLFARKLNHGGNPVLEWMAGNVATETDAAGNIKPSKKTSRERIDGIVATVMALSRYLVHNKPQRSKYEAGGLRTL